MNFGASPWKNVIDDNFFKNDPMLYKILMKKKETYDYIVMDTIQGATKFVYTFTEKDLEYSRLCKCFEEYLYNDKIRDFLNVEYDKTNYLSFEIVKVEPDYCYPIHIDHERKKCTAVVYLYPQESSGTVLYDSNEEYSRTSKWKQKRVFMFTNNSEETYHSYHNDTKTYRYTLNAFLLDADTRFVTN